MPAEIDVAIISAGNLEHPPKAVTTGKSSAILAASIFRFGQIPIPEAKQYLKERGIHINMERTWLLNKLGN